MRLAATLTGFKIDLQESASVSDLDAAMRDAAEDGGSPRPSAAADKFAALFSATPDGEVVDARSGDQKD